MVFEYENIWSLDIAIFESVEVGSNEKKNILKMLTLDTYTIFFPYKCTLMHVQIFKLLASFRIIHRAHISRM